MGNAKRWSMAMPTQLKMHPLIYRQSAEENNSELALQISAAIWSRPSLHIFGRKIQRLQVMDSHRRVQTGNLIFLWWENFELCFALPTRLLKPHFFCGKCSHTPRPRLLNLLPHVPPPTEVVLAV